MKFLLLALLCTSAFANSTFTSPDGKFSAVVQVENSGEIYVSLQNKAGTKTLAELNLVSQDSQHGRTLAKGAWSGDSRFFILTTESSGGHSPWHYTTYYYSRSAEAFRTFDERTGLSVASDSFTIDANDVLHFQAYNFSTQAPQPAALSLSHLDLQRTH